MPNSLTSPAVSSVLDRLFAAAASDDERPLPAGIDLDTADAQQRADALHDVYMPISRSAGRLLYALVRAARPALIVEFGTSFGISTLHLAAAVADNGTGRIVSTELSGDKVTAARSNLEQAGLAGTTVVEHGDALEILADLHEPVDLLLIDGWKELSVPVLELLEPRLTPGALVVADDTTFESMRDYLAYVRDPLHGFVSVDFPVEDGMELSCWTSSQ